MGVAKPEYIAVLECGLTAYVIITRLTSAYARSIVKLTPLRVCERASVSPRFCLYTAAVLRIALRYRLQKRDPRIGCSAGESHSEDHRD